ncbi:MAG TPA: hypothetical protein VG056_15535 [Pirellulales bacterium]|nr:hypothetical protein [Pirellulales bacterium]
MLAEDHASDAAAPTKAAAPPRARKTEAYTDAARLVNQRRISDLVPKSYFTIGLLFMAGMTAVAGLTAAHLYLPELSAWFAKDGISALELGGRGSLASWLSSLLLGLAGLTSLLIYSVRRHKLDDYRGHYRWWLVAAAAWLMMSVDATAGIHDLFRAAMTRLTAYSAPAAGHVWWIGCWGLLLAATVIRLLLDMRACRIALVTIMLALSSWSAALALQFAGARFPGLPSVLVVETLKLFGHLLLLFGVVLYARHVILHAQGLLPTRDQKPRKERAKKDAKTAASSAVQIAKIDGPHSSGPSGDKRSDHSTGSAPAATPHSHLAAATFVNSTSDDDSLDDNETDSDDRDRKLSKAERKRLRKQKSEERGW